MNIPRILEALSTLGDALKTELGVNLPEEAVQSSTEAALLELRALDPSRAWCVERAQWFHSCHDSPKLAVYTLSVLPGFDGASVQYIVGSTLSKCVNQAREAHAAIKPAFPPDEPR